MIQLYNTLMHDLFTNTGGGGFGVRVVLVTLILCKPNLNPFFPCRDSPGFVTDIAVRS